MPRQLSGHRAHRPGARLLVAAASASFCHWVPVSRWMEVDTFSYRAVIGRCGSCPSPREGRGWSGGVERHLRKPGPQTQCLSRGAVVSQLFGEDTVSLQSVQWERALPFDTKFSIVS